MRGRKSKLSPFGAEIEVLQHDGKSLREIALILKSRHDLDVHLNSIWSFLKTRAKHQRKASAAPALKPKTETNEQPWNFQVPEN
jgi:hypothetical protein